MKNLLNKIKNQLHMECSNPNFIHHKWYWQYHILPMVDIACNLARIFNVDEQLIELIVYLHDIGKIRGKDNHAEEGAKIASELLLDIPQKALIVDCIRKHNKPSENDCLEVKLIASADAASHFLSPFFEIYLWENPEEEFSKLCESNIKKAEKDYKKILLPQAQDMVYGAYEQVKRRYTIPK